MPAWDKTIGTDNKNFKAEFIENLICGSREFGIWNLAVGMGQIGFMVSRSDFEF